MGGVKVSSQQLSEWGSTGGRPKKYANPAERKRAHRLRKKQAQFGNQAQLAPRKTYGKVIIKKYLTCPNCGKINYDLSKYFNEKGEYIPQTYWFDTVRMKKINIRENEYNCLNCYQTFSFHSGKIKLQETKKTVLQAGNSTERSQRSRAKNKK
ncbi:hypothetical protein GvMRE_Ic4g3 [endosymbiont GvMRE of Glomus versiforme]|nr:hypothetical protein GvMRE_Ic4g3 [endosymbiont GvMRE of Glomus versiforme]